MRTCDVCGAQNEFEAMFCGTCGSRLPEVADAAQAEAVPDGDAAAGTDGGAEAAPSTADPDPTEVIPKAGAGRAAAAGSRTESAAGGSEAVVAPTRVASGWPALGKTATPPPTICPVCQTENDPSRTFCRKCASPLQPTVTTPARLITPAFVGRFLLAFLVGIAVPVGGAAAVTGIQNLPRSLPATPIALTLQGGQPLEFEIVPTEESAPIAPLPPTTTVQLASYTEAIAETPPGQNIQAKWWNDGVPRVPAISQFDGGPLQKVNCSMAAGAMLARLAFGIVTTGSQLRSLQDDQDGGTSFDNVNNALERGWGVKFLRGSLTALQLRALSYAGAGITVSLDYGQVPVGVRLQESFVGGHAVYVDAFRPAGPDGPAAYWVIDPIGHSWAGYKGGWWPAEDVERAALARNGGFISAAWAFAGGRIPDPRPRLPFEAYPNPIGEPPIEDPMPELPPPVIADPPTGTPPPEVPLWEVISFDQKVFEIDPGTSYRRCTTIPREWFCPSGIIGIFDLLGGALATPAPIREEIKWLYADAIAPGTYQVIFETPPDADANFYLWRGTSGELSEAKIESGVIDGMKVNIATISLEPNAGFSFFATATGDGTRALSDVGSVTVTK